MATTILAAGELNMPENKSPSDEPSATISPKVDSFVCPPAVANIYTPPSDQRPGDCAALTCSQQLSVSAQSSETESIAITRVESVEMNHVETSDIAVVSYEQTDGDVEEESSKRNRSPPASADPVRPGSGEGTPRVAGEEALADCIDDKFITSLLGPLNKMLGINADGDAITQLARTPNVSETAPVAMETVTVPTKTAPVPTETAAVPTETTCAATETTPAAPVPTVTTPVATKTIPASSKAVHSKAQPPAPQPTTNETQVRKAKDSRSKHKEDKSIEHILKALSSLQTSEEKLAALCHKYNELLDEHRLLQNSSRHSQRKITMMIREKDQLQNEHSKAVLAKSKLESLCRELQRHNKLVKEESSARAKEEEEKRKQVTTRFQTTISEIQTQMNEHHTKNTMLREENLTLATKLKSLITQYELQEQHVEKMLRHSDLEQQLMDAKLTQAIIQMTEEKKRNHTEKEIMLLEATEYLKKIQLLEAQEKHLRSQVSLYSEKYEEFQSTLAKSNDVFQSFKTEMDKMTKKIKKLEKETNMWRNRCENGNRSLLEMAEDKTRGDKEIIGLHNKIKKLESLCRALQDQRKKPVPANEPVKKPVAADNVKPTETAPGSSEKETNKQPETPVADVDKSKTSREQGEGSTDPASSLPETVTSS